MLLLVRSRAQLSATEAFFNNNGYSTLSFPISTINNAPISIPATTEGIIITSANALPSVPKTDLKVHCVGKKTAEEAKSRGFTIGEVGISNAQEFAGQLIQNIPPQELLHIAGDTAETNWYQTLIKANFKIKKAIGYTTIYTQEFTPEVAEALKNQQVKTVLFFSKAGAQRFIQLLHANGMQEKGLHATAFSAHIGTVTKNFAKTACASRPTLQGMLKTLTAEI